MSSYYNTFSWKLGEGTMSIYGQATRPYMFKAVTCVSMYAVLHVNQSNIVA